MEDANHVVQGPLEVESLRIPPDLSLGDLLLGFLKKHKNKVALIDAHTGVEVTFKEVLDQSIRLARNLKRLGLRKNDMVGICSENRLEFILPVLALLYNSAICIPVNHSYTEEELLHVLGLSKPKVVFVSPSTLERVRKAGCQLGCLQKMVVFDANSAEQFATDEMITLFSQLVATSPGKHERSEDFVCPGLDPRQQTAVILCSSGTTGLPKGVMLSHTNMMTFLMGLRDERYGWLSGGDVMLGLLPFFHGYGYGLLMCLVMLGFKMVVLSSFQERFFLESIQKYKIKLLPLVPTLMVFLAKHPLVSSFDLTCVKKILCGASPLSPDIAMQVVRRLGGNPTICQAYGMTELSLVVVMSPIEGITNPNTVGKVLQGVMAKVVDEATGQSLGADQVGELCFKGSFVMQGYLHNPRETASTIDSHGWLHTGDVGYYNQQGYFYIVDRIKDLIKYKSYQVAPSEIEAILMSHPAVQAAAVIGVPDEEAGELPMAFVVKQPGAVITANEIIDFAAKLVSPQKRLRGGVKFVSLIPINPSGKILRRQLRDQLRKNNCSAKL